MAVATVTQTALETIHGHSVTAVWGTLANGDSTTPISCLNQADRSIQIKGTFGAGGNVIIEGTNDDPLAASPSWVTLHDLQGNALATVTAAGIYMIAEITRGIRARVSAGDGTTALTATMVARSDV